MSVVVPCYRCTGTIRRAIASVTAQTVLPAELILVDDASRDGTLELLEELRNEFGRDWIRVIALPSNRGPGAARNAGWDAASSRLIAFLDADDAWHPEKLERQVAFMHAHPEIALSGHASCQLREGELPPPPGGDGYRHLTRLEILLSNRFVTPSAMVRRDVQQRFDANRRHMEDHLLWLEIISAGLGVARLDAVLACTFKAPFGEAGQSQPTLAMHRGELANYRQLHRAGHIGAASLTGLWLFSWVKYLRRLGILLLNPRGATAKLLFPMAFMTVTHSITALYIGLGLLGRAEVAADIALVHGALLATFYAFSANTRNLILGQSGYVAVPEILLSRLALLLPLAAATFALGVYGAGVAPSLVLPLVLRRAVEWLNEIHLSQLEIQQRVRAAQVFLLVQALLLGVALTFLAGGPTDNLWILYVWALAPLALSARYLVRTRYPSTPSFLAALRRLVPHFASTAIVGLAIFAFRLLVSLLAPKAVAGELFTAIGIGSFIATLFANVFGPSLLLHRRMGRRVQLPPTVAAALWAMAAAGLGIAIVATLAGPFGDFAGQSRFFWQATGLALAAGALMVSAQRVRLRLVQEGHGSDVFGPDLLSHILLVAAVPVVIFVAGLPGLLALYPLNAVLSYLFYRSAERDVAEDGGERRFGMPATAIRIAIGIALLFPLFFLLSGEIYNPIDPVVDSGGALSRVPIPISVIACYGGILLLGNYRYATREMLVALAMFGLMLLASIVTTSGLLLEERAKLLLLLQTILPVFALVLGAVYERPQGPDTAFERAALVVLALVVPVQLALSWAQESIALTHSLHVFSVYQHFQYVPVVFTAAYLVALFSLWDRSRLRAPLALLGVLLALYALGSFSFLSIALLATGFAAFAALRYARYRERAWMAVLLIGTAGAVGYLSLGRGTLEFFEKFSSLLPASSQPEYFAWKTVSHEDGVFEIKGAPRCPSCYLISLKPREVQGPRTFIAEGELRAGGLLVGLVRDEQWAETTTVLQPGRFQVELSVRNGTFTPVVASNLVSATENDATIERLGWRDLLDGARSSGEGAHLQSEAPHGLSAWLPKNVVKRFSDWSYFAVRIFEGPMTVLFGHPRPVDRSILTSAHNYYLDFAYNFGVIALMPLGALVVYTAQLLFRRRRQLLSDPGLIALVGVVIFLVAIDSSFKVTLRQPYPGIFAFFAWGLLLSRLRHLGQRARRL